MIKGDYFVTRAVLAQVCLGILLQFIEFGHGKPVSLLGSPRNATSSRDVVSTTMDIVPPTAHTLQQEKINPLEIDDGQSVQDKLRIMYLLAALERRVENMYNLKNNSSEEDIKINTADMPYLFEGDIILQPDQAEDILENGKRRRKRKLHANATMLWQTPIWYTFSDGEYNETDAKLIEDAITYWEKVTCITFKKINYSELYNQTVQSDNTNNMTLHFTNSSSGCWSYVGKRVFYDNVQKISASRHCMTHGRLVHELGHVIGFWHEHARPDRDDHVTVHNNAIQDGKAYNFIKLSWREIDDKNISYDVGSIMHYSSKAFATYADVPTLVAKEPLLQRALGQRQELSFLDVKLANTAYCMDKCDPTQLPSPCQHDGYQDPKNCSRCRCPDGLTGDFCQITQSHIGVQCGGDITINSTNEKIIFGFHGTYSAGQKCTWRIKTNNDTNIRIKFDGDHMMYYGCTDDPYVTCRDFVEVRYFHNMAATGARFCCYQRDNEPSILSHGNEMLVIMRSYGPGVTGFKANITAERCGGVVGSNETDFRPCTRRLSYPCPRQWQTKVREPCTGWLAWNTNCHTIKVVNVTREGLCYETENYCSHGFKLQNHVCIAASNSSAANSEILKDNTTKGGYSSNNGSIQNDPGIVPASWSEWSACSRTCGGCGVQTRQRTCSTGASCGSDNTETESRACEQQPCYTGIAQMCPTVRSSQSYCPFSLKIIRQEWIEYPICLSSCCGNYVQKEDKCIMWTPRTEQC